VLLRITREREVNVKFLRIPEVAQLLDVSVPRAYEMVRRGLLPAVRIGRQVRVHPEQLQAWIALGGRPLTHDVEADASAD
jgi:excisionase family DNA binding protein